MLTFGIPTLIEHSSPAESAAFCSQLSLQFVELNMNLPMYQPDRLDAGLFRALSGEYGVFFTVHMDENLNVSDFNPHISRAWMETVRKTIDFCLNIHAPVMNMHLPRGVYFTLPAGKVYLFEQYRERYLSSLLALREECSRLIGNAPLSICIENTEGFLPFQREAIDLCLESPLFALTLDVGHSHTVGGTDEDFILSRASSLRHMHLHDAAGSKSHLPLGTGDINIIHRLGIASEYACRVVLETKTADALRSSVQWLTEHGCLAP